MATHSSVLILENPVDREEPPGSYGFVGSQVGHNWRATKHTRMQTRSSDTWGLVCPLESPEDAT